MIPVTARANPDLRDVNAQEATETCEVSIGPISRRLKERFRSWCFCHGVSMSSAIRKFMEEKAREYEVVYLERDFLFERRNRRP